MGRNLTFNINHTILFSLYMHFIYHLHIHFIGKTVKKTVSKPLIKSANEESEKTPLMSGANNYGASGGNFLASQSSTDWDTASLEVSSTYQAKSVTSTTASMNNYVDLDSNAGDCVEGEVNQKTQAAGKKTEVKQLIDVDDNDDDVFQAKAVIHDIPTEGAHSSSGVSCDVENNTAEDVTKDGNSDVMMSEETLLNNTSSELKENDQSSSVLNIQSSDSHDNQQSVS